MPLLIDATGLADRRDVATGPLAPLAGALAGELTPLLDREPFIPEEKARLTRVGGWCPRDGTRLEFDPWSPRAHRCPACGAVETAEEHYRLWIMWYQLWLAERAVHGALLFALRGDARHAALARSLLVRWAELYPRYPNRDNALGPTRPFFSTYLESIWLLQLCIALDLLESAGAADGCGGEVRDRLIMPSRALIASFDEGRSNRQVWNAAALLASARLLGDAAGCEDPVYGQSGVQAHLANGLLEDGTWFEGENYHLFAHRGLWYGVTMAEQAELPLAGALLARFDEGFVTPLLTALPDLTLPARRDSQYAISLRQWRFAELCELGLARREDARLLGALGELYSRDMPRRPTGRDRSAAEVERNEPATSLTRADLGWKSLLRARPSLPPFARHAPASVLLEGQGLAILRRERGRVYASLDYGHSGGGHGHPDRLNVQLAEGDVRWLDDPGTGSYVDRSLHWYRSTLAHNAPLVDGRSQIRVHGRLVAWQDAGDAGWVRAMAEGTAPGVRALRTLVALESYVLDVLDWEADREVVLDLPVHLEAETSSVGHWVPATLEGGDGVEDGFEFLRSSERAVLEGSGATVVLRARRRDRTMDAHVHAPGAEWWRATAPGAPGRGDASFHLVRMRGTRGRLVSCWTWSESVAALDVSDATIVIALVDGSRHHHRGGDAGWTIDRSLDGSGGRVELGGVRVPPGHHRAPAAAGPGEAPPLEVPTDGWLTFDLGERHYRRSEESWREAGSPRATVRLAMMDGVLALDVQVHKPEPRFVAADATNPFDNEHPDIDGDGVQLYLATDAGQVFGWMVIPEPTRGTARSRPIAGYAGSPSPAAELCTVSDGWRVQIRLPLKQLGVHPARRSFELGLIVNTISPGRERRSGQLVLGGGAGEWTYLRGDRHAAGRLIPLVAPHA